MARYRNKRTGIVVSTAQVLEAAHWVPVTEDKPVVKRAGRKKSGE